MTFQIYFDESKVALKYGNSFDDFHRELLAMAQAALDFYTRPVGVSGDREIVTVSKIVVKADQRSVMVTKLSGGDAAVTQQGGLPKETAAIPPASQP